MDLTLSVGDIIGDDSYKRENDITWTIHARDEQLINNDDIWNYLTHNRSISWDFYYTW